jgi:RsmE family RNA methyltransferase
VKFEKRSVALVGVQNRVELLTLPMESPDLERWRRVALASAKQSRRAVLPEIRMPLTLETALGEPAAALRLMMVEPGAAAACERISALQRAPVPEDAVVFVGPEGGWAAEELTAAQTHGVRLTIELPLLCNKGLQVLTIM